MSFNWVSALLKFIQHVAGSANHLVVAPLCGATVLVVSVFIAIRSCSQGTESFRDQASLRITTYSVPACSKSTLRFAICENLRHPVGKRRLRAAAGHCFCIVMDFAV